MTTLDLLKACENCYDSPTIITPGGRDGASILDTNDGSLLIFRGTLTEGAVAFLDWLNDLRAELVCRPEYPGYVHRGWDDALAALWPLLPELKPPLIIAGHSKGGALAVLMAARLYRLSSVWRNRPPRVVTFGAPRVGNKAFAAMAALVPIMAYEGPHDLVPRLPPLEYRSVGWRITAPDDWQAPRGIEANHSLRSGYLPWIIQNDSDPASQRKAAA